MKGGENLMNDYEVVFFWQNHDRKEVVSAENGTDARKIIEARYPGARVYHADRKR